MSEGNGNDARIVIKGYVLNL